MTDIKSQDALEKELKPTQVFLIPIIGSPTISQPAPKQEHKMLRQSIIKQKKDVKAVCPGEAIWL